MNSPRIYRHTYVKKLETLDFYPVGSKSPTGNRQTHDRWGAYHLRSLDELHKSTKPTHWATLKFHRNEDTDAINRLLDSLGTAIRYQNKKIRSKSFSGTLSIFGVQNAEPDGSLHYHILIRSTLDDPAAFLARKINSLSRKNGLIATISYCERPVSINAVTKYPFKLGSDTKPILKKGSGARHVFQYGTYFNGKLKRAMERRNLWIWQDEQDEKFFDRLREMESDADKVLGCWEDFLSPSVRIPLPKRPKVRTCVGWPHQPAAIIPAIKRVTPLIAVNTIKSPPRIRSPCILSQQV